MNLRDRYTRSLFFKSYLLQIFYVVFTMANLRLYRDFYCINHTSFNNDVYNLLIPAGISAYTYILSSTTIIETLTVNNESTGKYYVDLNPLSYSFDNTYELKWNVLYNNTSSVKILITRFRLNPYNITAPFDVEINSSNKIDIELINNNEINIEL